MLKTDALFVPNLECLVNGSYSVTAYSHNRNMLFDGPLSPILYEFGCCEYQAKPNRFFPKKRTRLIHLNVCKVRMQKRGYVIIN